MWTKFKNLSEQCNKYEFTLNKYIKYKYTF
jgi:hypothetical protein